MQTALLVAIVSAVETTKISTENGRKTKVE
jgi:hypothetical protein